jgi:hypothetical protein
LYYKRSFYQDRLGTNIGTKVEKKSIGVFCSAWLCSAPALRLINPLFGLLIFFCCADILESIGPALLRQQRLQGPSSQSEPPQQRSGAATAAGAADQPAYSRFKQLKASRGSTATATASGGNGSGGRRAGTHSSPSPAPSTTEGVDISCVSFHLFPHFFKEKKMQNGRLPRQARDGVIDFIHLFIRENADKASVSVGIAGGGASASGAGATWGALTLSLCPLHFFFVFLFYTDLVSRSSPTQLDLLVLDI